jgi:hypothetical protein
MAAAKRVAQPKKRVDGWRSSLVRTVLTLEVDGKVEDRYALAQNYEVKPETTYVPQEDRIALDLSLAEAQAVLTSINYSTNSKARDIRQALRSALSPQAGTQASSEQANCKAQPGSLLRPAVDLSAKMAEASSTRGCGGTSPLA